MYIFLWLLFGEKFKPQIKMSDFRKLQHVGKKPHTKKPKETISQGHHHCKYPGSIRSSVARSCDIPSFWEFSTVLQLAVSQGWGSREPQWGTQQVPIASALISSMWTSCSRREQDVHY